MVVTSKKAKVKSSKRKKAMEKWTKHCLDVQKSTATLLDSTNENQSSRIMRAKTDYGYFVTTYFPHLATKACGKFQIEAANYILKNNRARGIFEWARGHAKSTHLSLLIPLWLRIQDERDPLVMVLVSKSNPAAKELLSDLQAELESNELYKRDFSQQKGEGSWADGKFITADGDMFLALGRGQSPRGIKKSGIRVNYISIDDIDDDEMSRNPRRVKQTADWCLGALFGSMDMGRGRFVIVGNRFDRHTVIGTLADTKKNFFHTTVNVLDKNGRPTWKENFTLKEIQEVRQDMGEARFQREYMNNPVREGSVFEEKYMRYGKMLSLSDYASLICYTDPSFKSSTKNDFKATVLVGITKKGVFHVLKVFADQTKVSTMVDWHYQMREYVRGLPVRYMMESGFVQDLLLDEFKKVGNKKGFQIPILPDTRKKPDKFQRIENLQPLFQRYEVIFNEKEKGSQGMEVMIDQLLLFEKGSRNHDDAPDALEGAIWILSNRERVSNNRHIVGKRANRHY